MPADEYDNENLAYDLLAVGGALATERLHLGGHDWGRPGASALNAVLAPAKILRSCTGLPSP